MSSYESTNNNIYDNNSNYVPSSYSEYATEENKYECQKGPLEGFFVSSVEFCKQVKFDDKKDRDNKVGPQGPPGPQGPAGSGNNNSTLVNTFNCINPNVININTETNQSSLSSLSGLQQLIQNGVAQGLNGTLAGLSQNNLNKTIVNLCFINDNDNIVIEEEGEGNGTQPQSCEGCFNILSETQLDDIFPIVTPGEPTIGTLVQLCNILEGLPAGEEKEQAYTGVFNILDNTPSISDAERDAVLDCLVQLGLITPPTT